MRLHNPKADVFAPDGSPVLLALQRTTHLAIGAHQDDLEILALHGILQCFDAAERWFTGITCTDGAGSPRQAKYAECTDEEMQELRREEQRQAARVGHYSAILQLGYSSAAVRQKSREPLIGELTALLSMAAPEVVYTHNLADKHNTHVAIGTAVVDALRRIPKAKRPGRLLGVEIWRSLDWLPDNEKVLLDVGGKDLITNALLSVFDSQIAGGKRYDLGTLGRRRANATYLDPHHVDTTDQISYAMDLTPLIQDDTLDLAEYVSSFLHRLEQTVRETIKNF